MCRTPGSVQKGTREAHGPLALRILGSLTLSAPLKLSLYMSLVESPNSFSVHVTPPSVNALWIVASVYNRALRRIAGGPRCERVEHAPSDLDIRRKLRASSYDCIMVRGRLRYVGRIIPGHNRQLFWPCCLFNVAYRLPLPRGLDQRMRTCTLRGTLVCPLPSASRLGVSLLDWVAKS